MNCDIFDLRKESSIPTITKHICCMRNCASKLPNSRMYERIHVRSTSARNYWASSNCYIAFNSLFSIREILRATAHLYIG